MDNDEQILPSVGPDVSRFLINFVEQKKALPVNSYYVRRLLWDPKATAKLWT